MNTTWLTWRCFLEGLQALGLFTVFVATIFGLVAITDWLVSTKGLWKLAVTIWITLFSLVIVILTMLNCARMIH